MSKLRVDASRLCKYYKHETGQKISCCGIYPNSVLHQGFSNIIDARDHKKRYCNKEPNECPIREMLEGVIE